MRDQFRFPETYDDLKDSFSTIWADYIHHPWKSELQQLEEIFWEEPILQADQIQWTSELQNIYMRMQQILQYIRILQFFNKF